MRILIFLFLVNCGQGVRVHPQKVCERMEVPFAKGYQYTCENMAPFASGAFGEVHKVLRLSDKKVFAMKVQNWRNLSYDDLQDHKKLAVREFKAMATCSKHENVIQLIEVFDLPQDRGIVAIIEYAPDGSLINYVDNNPKKFSTKNLEFVFKTFLQAVLGLQYIHSQGFIHRDVKLENMVLKDGVVKIIDFGLCIEKNKIDDAIAGDPRYVDPMALIVGESNFKWTPASDVYGLGVVLHEMVFRRLIYPKKIDGFYRPQYESAAKKESFEFPEDTDETVVYLISRMTLLEPKNRISLDNVIDEITGYLKSTNRPKVKKTVLTNTQGYKRGSNLKNAHKKKKTFGCFGCFRERRALSELDSTSKRELTSLPGIERIMI
jgi:serine/threonine protein kinase